VSRLSCLARVRLREGDLENRLLVYIYIQGEATYGVAATLERRGFTGLSVFKLTSPLSENGFLSFGCPDMGDQARMGRKSKGKVWCGAGIRGVSRTQTTRPLKRRSSFTSRTTSVKELELYVVSLKDYEPVTFKSCST